MYILASALLLILSLPPVSFSLAGAFCLAPLLWSALKDKPLSAASNGFLLGLLIGSYCYLGAMTYDVWVYAILVFKISCATGFFFWGSARIFLLKQYYAIILVPLLWIFIELVLEFANIPFTLAISLTGSPVLLQIADIGGQYLISLLMMMFQVAFVLFLDSCFFNTTKNKNNTIIYGTVTLIPAVIVITYGVFIDSQYENNNRAIQNIAVVQTNLHPTKLASAYSDNGLEDLSEIRKNIVHRLDNLPKKADLIVWPEVSFSQFEFRTKNNITKSAADTGLPMLVPSLDLLSDGRIVNALFSVSGSGEVLDRHTKHILIPLLEEEFSQINEIQPHTRIPGRPGSLICFESAFSSLSRQLVVNGANFLTISTSDAYAGPSILPLLHHELARIRAIETRRFVVRSANAGPSSIIGPDGHILITMDLFKAGIISGNIYPLYNLTYYTKYGDQWHSLIWALSLIPIIIIIAFHKKELIPPILSTSVLTLIRPLTIIAISIMFCVLQGKYITKIYNDNNPEKNINSSVAFNTELDPDILSFKKVSVNSNKESLFASLAYILREYGLPVTHEIIADKAQQYNNEITIPNVLRELLASLDFTDNFQSYKNKYTGLKSLYTPCLAQMISGEIVALRNTDDNTVIFFSSTSGDEIAIKKSAFIRAWSGNALSLLPLTKPWDRKDASSF